MIADKYWNRYDLKKKLFLSHLTISMIGIVILFVVFVAILWLRDQSLHLTENRQPSVQMSMKMEVGIQRSISGLRGWIVLPEEKFRKDIAESWKQEIEPALKQLKQLEKEWNNPQTSKKLIELEKLLIELKEWQWWIEDVAHTEGNEPARVIYQYEILPSYESQLRSLNQLIDSEERAPSNTERKFLLSQFSKIIHKISRCELVLENTLTAKYSNGETEFHKNIVEIKEILEELWEAPRLFSEFQHSTLQVIEDEFLFYEEAAQRLFELKKDEKANLARFWLANQASPRARKLTETLNFIIDAQIQNLEGNTEVIKIGTWVIIGGILFLLIPGGVFVTIRVANLSARRIIRPISELTDATLRLSKGDLSQILYVEGQDEVGVLTKHFNGMQRTLKDVVQQSNMVAKGDYSVHIQPRSDSDELGMALIKMTEALKKATEANNRKDWLQSGQSELNDQIRGLLTPTELIGNALNFIAQYLDAQVGLAYLADKEELKFAAGYSYPESVKKSETIVFGQGMFGQAALDKKPILYDSIPKGHFNMTIESGFGYSVPKQIYILPLIYQQEIVAVLGFGKDSQYTNRQITFLEQIIGSLAINIHTAQARIRTQELLHQTQTQTEFLKTSEMELQAQQEELRAVNDQLSQQANSLRESEAELQAQQEELRVSNEELTEYAQTLEKKQNEVQQKNKELLEIRNELEGSNRELVLSNRYKAEFLANMSHELRTPLNSLLILAEILKKNKEKNLTAKQVSFANDIFESGHELLELINEVLDLSKVEAGVMEIHSEWFETENLIPYVKRLFGKQVENKGLEFRYNISEDFPKSIFVDHQRLEQIIKNLISNAIKFTNEGSIHLQLFLVTDHEGSIPNSENKKVAAFSITDTGIGIPKEKQDLVFRAFQQAEGGTSRKYGGTGLGLSISKELSNLLGGTISLKSEVNKGSTFTLFIPLLEEGEQEGKNWQIKDIFEEEKVLEFKEKPQESKPNIEQKSADESQIAERDVKKSDDDRDQIEKGDKSLLIIDDDPKFSRILKDIANEKGYKVLIANDGSSGLKLAEQYTLAGIILDIGLPDMDGWAVMNQLKASPKTRHYPVHFISGEDKSQEALQMGAVGYQMKPVQQRDLEKSLQRIEKITSKKIKNLLIVEDDEKMVRGMVELIRSDDVNTLVAPSGMEAINILKKEDIDCMVLDLGLKDMSGLDVLKTIKNEQREQMPPVIIYTGRELSKQQEREIGEYTQNIIIKGVKSMDRLLSEVTLFLHSVESRLPEEKQKLLRKAFDPVEGLNGKKVLLADDDPRNSYALSHILEENGLDIYLAFDGVEALNILQETKMDLVLMDIMMPEMDGYEAMREIRKEPKFRKLPIIALTAKAMKEDREKCIQAGANDYLSKPIDTAKLISLMRVWLSH